MKLVKDYMKRKVVYFKPSDSIFDAAKILSKRHISGAPVVKGGKVVGVISESDIIKFMKMKLPEADILTHEPHALTILVANFVREGINFIREIRKISKCTVEDFMSKEVISIGPDASILDAAEIMEKYHIDRLPVIEKGRLRGIIARIDLIKAMLA